MAELLLESMERAVWTDERLDDLAGRMDAGFDRVDGELRELRRELSTGMADMRVEHREDMQGLREEIHGARTELGEEIHGVRTDLGGRIDGLGGRIDGLDGRVDSLGDGLGGRIDALSGRVDALQLTMLRLGGGMIIGFAGLIATTLARG